MTPPNFIMTPNDPNDPAESEMLDVVVTLDVTAPAEVADAVANLKKSGLQVVKVDDANGVVEGTLAAEKFATLRHAPKVKYIRQRFRYMTRPSDQNQ